MKSKENLNEGLGPRIFGLDVLRSIAILTVVMAHGHRFLVKAFDLKYYGMLVFDGVTFFFVLSGFLIGGIFLRIMDRPTFQFKDIFSFWIRRWFRTLPNYYMVMVLLIITWHYAGLGLPSTLYKYFLFLQNFHDRHPNFFGEAWSLSIEEWFYLLVPFAITITYVTTRLNKRHIVLFWISFIVVVCTATRVIRFWKYHYSGPDYDLYITKQVVTRLDSLVYGVLGAFLTYYKVKLWDDKRNLFFILGIALLIFPKINNSFIHSGFFDGYLVITTNSIGTMLLLPKLITFKKAKGVPQRFFTLISKISYSMYLIHASFLIVIVFPFVEKWLHSVINNERVASLATYSVFWACTIAISYLMYTYFEHPITGLREKFTSVEPHKS
ncbi:MAG TPA: acyltransferase [Chitinophagales bacterium]|nr:acyltransferase [Chitinophagales bacterium]